MTWFRRQVAGSYTRYDDLSGLGKKSYQDKFVQSPIWTHCKCTPAIRGAVLAEVGPQHEAGHRLLGASERQSLGSSEPYWGWRRPSLNYVGMRGAQPDFGWIQVPLPGHGEREPERSHELCKRFPKTQRFSFPPPDNHSRPTGHPPQAPCRWTQCSYKPRSSPPLPGREDVQSLHFF